MNRSVLIAVMAGLGLALARPVCGEEALRLTRDADIEIREEGDFANVKGWLPELLGKYLVRSLGKETLDGPGEKVTFVLEARAAEWTGIPREEVKDVTDLDAFEIEIKPDARAVRISGATALAAGFGVMHFLEEYVGIVWLYPGELGTHVPRKGEFALPAGRQRVTPAFASRFVTGIVNRDHELVRRKTRSGEIAHEGVQHKHRFFFWGTDYAKSLRLHGFASPSHNMINIFPPEMKDEHPAIFPVVNGERWFPPPKGTPSHTAGARLGWSAWHPCYTEPTAVEIAATKAAAALEEGAFSFSLGINDGRRVRCECPRCRKVGWPDSYYQFVSKVAERLKEHYPPKMVGLIAYGDVATPPEDLKLPDNVLVMCVSGGPQRLKNWAPHATHLGTYEWAHGLGYWIPNMPLTGMKSNAEHYRESGVKFLRAEVHPFWAYDGPKVYLYRRLMWAPDLDLDAALRRYCDAAYGEGGEAVNDFFRHWAAKRDYCAKDAITPMHAGLWPFDLWRNPEVQFNTVSETDMAYSQACMDRARAAIQAELPRKRFEMLETFWEHTRTLHDMRRLASEALSATATLDWRRIVDRAQALEAKRRQLVARMRQRDEWFLGTKVEVDNFMQPPKLGRRLMVYPEEMANLIRTAAVAASRGEIRALEVPDDYRRYLKRPAEHPLELTARTEPPRPATHIPMRVTGRGETLRFKSTTDYQRVNPYFARAGIQRLYWQVHWLQGFTAPVPLGPDDLYAFEFKGSGQDGTLVVSLDCPGRNAPGPETYLVRRFGPQEGTLVREVVLPGSVIDPETQRPSKDDAVAQGRYEITVMWQPTVENAPLEGAFSLRRLHFDGDSAGP